MLGDKPAIAGVAEGAQPAVGALLLEEVHLGAAEAPAGLVGISAVQAIRRIVVTDLVLGIAVNASKGAFVEKHTACGADEEAAAAEKDLLVVEALQGLGLGLKKCLELSVLVEELARL